MEIQPVDYFTRFITSADKGCRDQDIDGLNASAQLLKGTGIVPAVEPLSRFMKKF